MREMRNDTEKEKERVCDPNPIHSLAPLTLHSPDCLLFAAYSVTLCVSVQCLPSLVLISTTNNKHTTKYEGLEGQKEGATEGGFVHYIHVHVCNVRYLPFCLSVLAMASANKGILRWYVGEADATNVWYPQPDTLI